MNKPVKLNSHEIISVRGARENNLKNLNIDIPKNQLVVITGLSGSGKSSLAFDTIYAEGQRRYLESLSSYARQFLGGNEKPDVDSIDGLSPAISIDQKSTSHNPRSTVGTVTEIYDYLRVLWARIGLPYCPNGHGLIKTQTIKQITDQIYAQDEDKKLQVLAPIVRNQKGTFKNEFEKLRQKGFLRVFVDGTVYSLDDKIELDKNNRHDISVVIDRIVLHHDNLTKTRLNDAIETAAQAGKGNVNILSDNELFTFSQHHSCEKCGFNIPELEPRLFSFNSPIGACSYCKGLGFTYEPDEERMMPNKSLSILEGGIDYFKNIVNTTSLDWQRFSALLKHYAIPLDVALQDLSKKQLKIILDGSDEPIEVRLLSASGRGYDKVEMVEGVAALIKRRHIETSSQMAREYYSKYMAEKKCDTCKGKKLSPSALSVRVGNLDIINFTELSINKSIEYLLALELTNEQKQISRLALKEIIDRLSFLQNVGLEYLTLARSAATLSGGESQRIRLATQIGSHLTGVLYVLDEPSIGLHQKDNDRLIDTLKSMRDLGNTLLVVEHDEDTMWAADHLIDIGPGAGENGGTLVAQGTPQEVADNSKSITGRYLSGKEAIEVPKSRRGGNNKKIALKGATGNNLKNIDVEFPLNKLVVVTGVSGSGKSTLVNQTLVPAIERLILNKFVKPQPYKTLDGIMNVDKIVTISQDPIGRTPRSNPATYVGVFDDIRDLFSLIPEAKARGYERGRFSFNVSGGRCERCGGDGVLRIEMHFLPDVYVKCEECNGKKYNDATLEIKYKGKSIYDVLRMSTSEALEFFKNVPNINRKLQLICDVGLDYLQLGTNATVLSGGEAQRIKLAKHLQKRATGKTIYVLDEPTTGLHSHDIKKLIAVLNRIVDHGDTVIVIEHNLDLIQVADYIIDLGPNGGDAGGKIIARGTPEQLIKLTDVSHTAVYLKKHLERWNQKKETSKNDKRKST
ncbi:excinuclease ABC subunit UvrA [[Mycoplasma] testudinis]|uniref:excinuclease ABC subunit UvrA n=1 Tax=[Mycoplasma] testudinis TaxID=33924 RepID=UPI00069679EA|nr:excinuclease ABC subunit UvrA [[Mycoplasma] testudinis]